MKLQSWNHKNEQITIEMNHLEFEQLKSFYSRMQKKESSRPLSALKNIVMFHLLINDECQMALFFYWNDILSTSR
ncbi:hypothetical protein [Kurthia senegalensis]|uniref:hypothetical protein n=1 Tax=Kurthia senegalensis TaxID=1033740 RepID=UPI000288E777|nr:hypothetical protein [Kurthia senegalensis]